MELFNLNTDCERFSFSQKCAHALRQWELNGNEEAATGRKWVVRPAASLPLAIAAIADTLLHIMITLGTLITGIVATPYIYCKKMSESAWNDLTWGASVRHFSVALEHFAYILCLPVCFIGSPKLACQMTDYRRSSQISQTAPTVEAKPSQTAPTVEAKPSQTVPTVEAKPSQTVPTVEAKPSQSTPTVEAKPSYTHEFEWLFPKVDLCSNGKNTIYHTYRGFTQEQMKELSVDELNDLKRNINTEQAVIRKFLGTGQGFIPENELEGITKSLEFNAEQIRAIDRLLPYGTLGDENDLQTLKDVMDRLKTSQSLFL